MAVWMRVAAQDMEWLDLGCTVKVTSTGLANIMDVT